MQVTTMQPSFAVDFPESAQQVMARIRSAIVSANLNEYSISAGLCAEFFVDHRERRFWSPHLSIQVHDTPSGSELVGRFSPRPEVWTMVMFVYFLMVFCICGGALFGCSQAFVGEEPWGFWAIPIATTVIAGLHLASLIGQHLSADQMQLLHSRLVDVLEIVVETSASDGVISRHAEQR